MALLVVWVLPVKQRIHRCRAAMCAMSNATGPGTRLHDGTASTLSDMGISKQQSSRWQKLAEVNEKEFESALADPEEKPSTSGMIRKANGKQNKMDEDALWLWGRMRDFESRIFDRNIAFLIDEMTVTMQSDLQRIAPQMVIFFQNLEDQINE